MKHNKSKQLRTDFLAELEGVAKKWRRRRQEFIDLEDFYDKEYPDSMDLDREQVDTTTFIHKHDARHICRRLEVIEPLLEDLIEEVRLCPTP